MKRYIRSDSLGDMLNGITKDLDLRVSRDELDRIMRTRMSELAKSVAKDAGVPNAWKKILDSLEPLRKEFVDRISNLNDARLDSIKNAESDMNSSIRDWYISQYPDDSAGNYLDTRSTFQDLFDALDTYNDIYDVLGTGDSLVRERVFEKLADIMDVDYDYIYDQWMLGAE